jgi:phosphatidylserine decarboxylase
MTTVSQSMPVSLTAAPITSVQPGGGLCMSIELTWARWRRGLLRRFWPAYVQAMQARRKGTCADCPHDVIDARDLKYYRNVCGYHFDAADDPFRWRDRLGVARLGLGEIACFSLLLLALALPLVVVALFGSAWAWIGPLILFAAWTQVVSFFRDPERIPPSDPQALLSPADGTVTDIGEIADPDFPDGRALRISIFLSVFNVHINRIPRSGRVISVRYYPGAFLDARSPDCGRRNEQVWIDFEDTANGRKVRVKQVAGAIARRIVCWLRTGEEVRAGERLGLIKYGSRTDVLVPVVPGVELAVKVGDTVKGAMSVLLRWPTVQG